MPKASAEKNRLVRAEIRHHNLRPVNHRRHGERQLVCAQLDGIAFLDDDLPVGNVEGIELVIKRKGLCVADDLHFGEHLSQSLDAACVVGLHVRYDEIIRFFVAEGFPDIGNPCVGGALVHRVHNADFFVHNRIGVVRHTVGYYKLTFEKVEIRIVTADVNEGVRDFINHSYQSLLYCFTDNIHSDNYSIARQKSQ